MWKIYGNLKAPSALSVFKIFAGWRILRSRETSIFLRKLILILFSKEKIYIERVTERKNFNQESKLISLQSRPEVSGEILFLFLGFKTWCITIGVNV